MKKIDLTIDSQKFLDWYFDNDIKKDFVSDQGIIALLKLTGKFSTSTESLVKDCAFIPANVLVESDPLYSEEEEIDGLENFKIILV